ncbi:MAG: hypothetical protein Q9227_007633 [Pyrenula ochraceoflavens]
MGVGRRMKKQGPPPSFEEIQALKKRSTAQDGRPAPRGKKRKIDAYEGVSPAVVTQKKTVTRGPSRTNGSSGLKATSPGVVAEKVAVTKPTSNGHRQTEVKKQKAMLPTEDDFGVDEDSIPSDLEEMESLDELPPDEMDLDGDGDDGDTSSNVDISSQSDSVFDSEEDIDPKTRFSEDEDESDAEQELTAANIEGLSRKLDKQQEEADAEAEQELQEAAMQTNIQDGPSVFNDAAQQKAGLAPDLQLIRQRMTDTIRILHDFNKLAEPEKSRAEYTSLLISDICTYYSYTPYLAEKLFSLFSPAEAFQFFEANETPRPLVIRTNTLRANRRTLAQSLINRGVVLEPVGKWSKVGLQVFESAVPLGATPQYLAGHYILQAASSFLPVMALAPQPHERVLDMAAAPGGKTTYISALMRNTGCVFANDSNRQRAKGLIGNIHRLGCKNTVVTNLDAKDAFPRVLGGFDRIEEELATNHSRTIGTGVISKDPSVKTSKNERDFLALPHRQKQLLLAAIDSTNHASKTGGYIVYSTCSVTMEENEGVVQYALSRRPNVRIVDTGLGTFGSEGFRKYGNKRFDERMGLSRRYFPQRENVDGFFVCKLKKVGPSGQGGNTNGSATKNGNGTIGVNGNGDNLDEDDDADPDQQAPFADTNGADTPATSLPIKDDFGGFDDEEDERYIEKAERNWLRRRGLNPRIAERKGQQDGELGRKDKDKRGSKSKKV